ncbi:MAG: alpha-glucan phosphorylase [Chlorobi bacterium]|nr:alpha-glucan phosphorylase [Chlorobiota bacterium]
MRPLVTFTVAPPLPETLGRLHELYSNLYWSWNPDIREFLRSIDPETWHAANHHPLEMMRNLPAGRLEERANDPAFMESYRTAIETLDGYLNDGGWYGASHANRHDSIAYLSAEFGLHESVPLYSGGLGVLSGDHTKSASDLGLPFVCVGLMYQMGYFRQRLTLDGAQLESYDMNDPSTVPLREMLDAAGRPIRISVDFPRGPVHARIWRLDVGRVPIYLLDTNISENAIPEYRDIADYLYGGDLETRIMQEIMLGIGGMRALRALGIDPTVTHSNEGHSAFLMLERSRMLMTELGMNFMEAAELAASGSVFTTHTPVPAGNDAFPLEMIDRYFSGYWPQLGLSRDEFISLGHASPVKNTENFSMTVLALKLTSKRNGVSQLHGHVSQSMWKEIWNNLPASEIPIEGITNGVHTLTWIADPMRTLLDAHLGTGWTRAIGDPETWDRIDMIPNADLWRIKNHMRTDLVDYVHRRLDEQHAEWYSRTETGRHADTILDPSILTIGFARRFATYKRATLLFRDPERALRLFGDRKRPIQLVFAGKAHPKDLPGKEFIQKVIEFIRENELESRIVFIEDYDMGVARQMTQGCDVWLNTPRRPLEASGTSGMKAAVNGTLNLSVLDGWYPEGYDGTNGFAIGKGEEFANPEHQDEFESRKLYRVLEESLIPMFYNRSEADIPREWIAMQKRALRTMAGAFSADRMVTEYATRFYLPCSDRFQRLRADGGARVRGLIAWKRHIMEQWSNLRFHDVQTDAASTMKMGQQVRITARLQLGEIAPADIRVEAYYGEINAEGLVSNGATVPLAMTGNDGGLAIYTGTITLASDGHAGLTVRALPWHEDLGNRAEMNTITWAL